MKRYLSQVGVTPDGKKIYSGVFKFFSAHGLPLDVLFNLALEQNWMPCWVSFYKEAIAAGMNHKRVLAKLEEAIADSYGVELSKTVIEKLEQLSSRK